MGLGNIKINLNLLYCKPFATFSAAALEKATARRGTDTASKAVTAAATTLRRLVGAFNHDAWIILD